MRTQFSGVRGGDSTKLKMRDLHVSDTLGCPGDGTPKNTDGVNIGDPSIFNLTRKAAVLTRMLSTLVLSCEENTTWWKWKSPLVGCRKLNSL